MNIGIVTTWFPSGGGYVSKAYRTLLTERHDVYIYARQGDNMKGHPRWDDNKVYWAKPHYNGININDFKRWIQTNKIELIFFNEQRYWKPVIIAKQMGICIGAYIDYYKEDTLMCHSLYDFLICNTNRHFSAFEWHPKAYLVPWGVDLDVFKPRTVKENKNINFLISLGWEGKYKGDRKGLMLAITAFTRITGQCTLLIYSQVHASECLLPWKRLIESDSRIHFIYGTFDPFPYDRGDVYVYPARLDGIGLSLPEALSCGVPAITTDNPPMNEFVVNGVNGVLVGVDRYIARWDGYYWPQSICNIDSLIEAMQTYVDNPHLITVQGLAARQLAEKKLNWRNNCDNILSIFEDSLEYSKCVKANVEAQVYALQIDRSYCPSLTYRCLICVRDVLKHMGIRISPFYKLRNIS
jgi:1,2-diacylglycerol 3-alpha-glucosyltransferase